jgi:replicative DNA helicase
MDRLPPQNIEAEAAVLGSILIDPQALSVVAELLHPEDFYRDAHRLIFQAAHDLYSHGSPADLVTLTDEIERRGKLEQIGGADYLTMLVNIVPTSANVEYYALIVERTAILRKLIHVAGQIAALAYSEEDAAIALEKAEQLIFSISQNVHHADFEHIRDILDAYFDKLDYLHDHRGDVVGIPTGFSDLDKMTGGLQRSDLIILAARPSIGKCLTAHTLIDDPHTGARLTIEECYRRQVASVMGISAKGHVRQTTVTDWIDSGVQPCFRVTTRSGRSVEVTGHHPFLTVHGWTALHDLHVGDTIAVPTKVPAFGQDESWPIELVRLLAYFIAEGGLTDHSPEFTNTDPIIIEDFQAIIRQHFPACSIRRDKITYIVAQKRIDMQIMPPNPVTTWLKELGLWGKLAKEKAFPACVWTWSKRYLSEFLRVLMSCDGSIFALQGYPRIEFTVASPQLAADVQHAFIRFGLTAKFYRTSQGAWRVEISAPDSIRRYQEEIGWLGEKTLRFTNSVWTVPLRFSNVGHPPKEIWHLVQQSANEHGLSMVELARRSHETVRVGHNAGYNPHTKRGLTRHRLAAYEDVLGNEQLRTLASHDLYWDPITSIEAIGMQQVYDLTVPDGANFIAQDICVHNTALALSLAHNSAVRFGASLAIFSLEMSKEQLAQRLLSMDAGVDQQRLRTGFISDADDEWARISTSVGRLSESNIYIDDTAGISLIDMRSKARRLKAERGFDVLILDYLQLMQGTGSKGDGNRQQEISEISRGLKGLARELNVPILALSQLSRAVESRTSKVPQLSDLRESGCITGDSLVYLPDEGIYRRIDALVGQRDFNVLALNRETWQLELAPVTNAFATGRKPVFRLTTRLGRTIRATANHQFLTINGWQRLDALAPEMRIALPRTLPGPIQQTMSDSELGLLGHLIGDGCTLPRQPIHYTTNDMTLAETVARLAREVFGDAITPRIKPEHDWIQVYLAATEHLTHNVRNPIAAWLDELGVFGLRSHEKFVPHNVFAQPTSAIAVFLRHLWSTDGCINLSEGIKHYANVYYASSSERLARDVQSLLLRLDINATLTRHSQGEKGRDQFHTTVSGKGDIERFLSLVGSLGTAKVAHHAAMTAYLVVRESNTNRDVVPNETWRLHVVPSLQNIGMTTRQLQTALEMQYCGSALYKSNLSRARASRVAQVVASDELALLAASDVYWDRIVSIVPEGEEDVYDMTVEDHHNFIANDVIVHNSIEQDADIVMFIYRDEIYNPETERPNIADIIVAKHRNGPVGTVSLYFQPSQTRFRDLELQRVEDL